MVGAGLLAWIWGDSDVGGGGIIVVLVSPLARVTVVVPSLRGGVTGGGCDAFGSQEGEVKGDDAGMRAFFEDDFVFEEAGILSDFDDGKTEVVGFGAWDFDTGLVFAIDEGDDGLVDRFDNASEGPIGEVVGFGRLLNDFGFVGEGGVEVEVFVAVGAMDLGGGGVDEGGGEDCDCDEFHKVTW